MEVSVSGKKHRGKEKKEEPLCLIQSDYWAPLFNRLSHLGSAQENQSTHPGAGVRRPCVYVPNRLSSSVVKEIVRRNSVKSR